MPDQQRIVAGEVAVLAAHADVELARQDEGLDEHLALALGDHLGVAEIARDRRGQIVRQIDVHVDVGPVGTDRIGAGIRPHDMEPLHAAGMADLGDIGAADMIDQFLFARLALVFFSATL